MGRVKQAMMDGVFDGEDKARPQQTYIVEKDLVVGDLGVLLVAGTQVSFDGLWVEYQGRRARCAGLKQAIAAGYLQSHPS